VVDTSTTPVPTYALAANAGSVNEGSTATFTVTTTNVVSGTSLAYTISGVSAADVVGGSLSGTATVGSDGRATINVPLASDLTTEGNETVTVTVQGQTSSMTVVDASTTPVPTYALAANAGSVNEGSTATFTVTTTNVASGTSLAYMISGVSAADVVGGSLSGTATVGSDGRAVVSVDLVADRITEGDETLVVLVQGKSATLTIKDTSINTAPVSSNWSVITSEDTGLTGKLPASSDLEGDAITFSQSSEAKFGKATVTADGSYSYVPNKDFNGADSLSFQVTDAKGASNDYVVAITVTSVNDSPSLPSSNRVTAVEDTASKKIEIGAIDVDGDTLT